MPLSRPPSSLRVRPKAEKKPFCPHGPARRPPAAGARQGRAPDFRLSRPQNAPVLSADPRRGGAPSGAAPLSARPGDVSRLGRCPGCSAARAPALPPVVWGRRLVGGRVFPLFRELRVAGIAADFQQGDRRRLSRGSARIYPGRLPAIPQSASLTAPFTQGSLGRRLFFGRGRGRGPIVRRCLVEKRVFPLFIRLWAAGLANFQQRERRKLSRGSARIYPGRLPAIPQPASLTAPFAQGSLEHPVF